MDISYLITLHNETTTFKKSLYNLVTYGVKENDEIIILDDYSDNKETINILSEYLNTYPNIIKHELHPLNKNYGAHKNYGTSVCKNPWIFQIDADEIPPEILLENLKEIIKENPKTEVFLVPRLNDVIGVTQNHAKMWGWKLTPSPRCNNRPVINWPDYQSRIYKNDLNKIKWNRRLHEKLEGHSHYSYIPAIEELALLHEKTIEIQLNTNKRYNEWFTPEENAGHRYY